MAIGQHVAKALADKAAREAAPVDPPGPDTMTDDEDSIGELKERPDEPTMAQVLAMMAQLLKESRASGSMEQKQRLAFEAERLLLEKDRLSREMPENKQPPLVSVFNPEGERDHPRTAENGRGLRCKTRWCGHELRNENLTTPEIQMINRLLPGDYQVTKADGSRIPFTVTATENNAGELEEVLVWFPCKGDQRQNHGSMTSYMQQALGDRIPTAAELMAELEKLKAELALVQQGVGA